MRGVSVLRRRTAVASRPMAGVSCPRRGRRDGAADRLAVGQRGVQAGAGAQLVLPGGGGRAHVGTEVTDRLGRSRRPSARYPAMPCGVSFSAARDSRRTTRAPMVMPMASQKSRRIRRPAGRRAGPAAVPGGALRVGERRALTLLLRRAADAVAEGGDLDQRAARVAAKTLVSAATLLDTLAALPVMSSTRSRLALTWRDRRGGLARGSAGSAPGPGGWSAWSRPGCAELQQRHRQQQDQHHHGQGRDEPGPTLLRTRVQLLGSRTLVDVVTGRVLAGGATLAGGPTVVVDFG